MLLSAEEDEMEEGMIRLTRDQKLMIGTPVLFVIGMLSLALPVAYAVRLDDPRWLALWLPGALMFGAMCAALKGWTDE